MWSYVKMPPVPGAGAARLEKFCVSQGDVLERNNLVAVAQTAEGSFGIFCNYRGRVLEIIRSVENSSVSCGEPIARLELLEDPAIDSPPIEYWRELKAP
jgi:hypothetical protein